MHTIVATPCGMRQLGRIESSIGRAVMFEAVALPLAVDSGRAPRVTLFSQVLASLGGEEHSRKFRDAGLKAWFDLGLGLPKDPPPL
jgi:hypothetical protein